MKKTLSTLFLFGFLATGSLVYAQQEIDECWEFNNAKNYEKAIEAGKLAVEKYPENPEAYRCLGTAYYNVGETELANENMKKSESLANNKRKLASTYAALGLAFVRMGNVDGALSSFIKGLELAKDLGDRDMQAVMLNGIGMVYNHKGELDKALSYYEKSLSLATNEKTKENTYNNIAVVYREKGDYQEAVKYFKKAIEIDEKYGDYLVASKHKLNLGDTYREIRDYKNAEKYLFEGFKDIKKVNDKYWEAMAYKYLGDFYRDKGDKKTARKYYTHSYNLFKSTGAIREALLISNDIEALGMFRMR
jgi:tetratricopeptide (TPR) repeat protein